MPTPMPFTTNYQAGDLVLVDFPFTSSGASKPRPALVILDTGDADVLLARLTTQPQNSPFDVSISGWKQAGLLRPRPFACTSWRPWPRAVCDGTWAPWSRMITNRSAPFYSSSRRLGNPSGVLDRRATESPRVELQRQGSWTGLPSASPSVKNSPGQQARSRNHRPSSRGEPGL